MFWSAFVKFWVFWKQSNISYMFVPAVFVLSFIFATTAPNKLMSVVLSFIIIDKVGKLEVLVKFYFDIARHWGFSLRFLLNSRDCLFRLKTEAGMVTHTCSPSTWEPRQEESCAFKASVLCIVSSRKTGLYSTTLSQKTSRDLEREIRC